MSVQHGSDPSSSSGAGAGQYRYGSGATSTDMSTAMGRWYNEQPHDSPYNAIGNVDTAVYGQGHGSKSHKSHKGHKKSGK